VCNSGIPRPQSDFGPDKTSFARNSWNRVRDGDYYIGYHQMVDQIGNMVSGILRQRALAPRYLVKTALELMQHASVFLQWLSPIPDSPKVWAEFQNKIEAFSLFEYVDSEIGVFGCSGLALHELVLRTSRLGPYRSVWAMEGLGHHYAESQRMLGQMPSCLLSEQNTGGLPNASLVPLHTGMGLSLAESVLGSICKQPADCGWLVDFYRQLCDANSRPGYSGAAFEALGLIARHLYPHLILPIDSCLANNDDDLARFWHGIGRGTYFLASNFPPFCSAPWKAFDMCLREPPHELGRRNAVAGLAWALTLVNIRHPEILAVFLKHHGNQVTNSHAFAHGIRSAMIIWLDASPDDAYLEVLRTHVPGCVDAFQTKLWNAYVKQSCEEAVHYHKSLPPKKRLEDFFRYQD
jgi:hypothetical protein